MLDWETLWCFHWLQNHLLRTTHATNFYSLKDKTHTHSLNDTVCTVSAVHARGVCCAKINICLYYPQTFIWTGHSHTHSDRHRHTHTHTHTLTFIHWHLNKYGLRVSGNVWIHKENPKWQLSFTYKSKIVKQLWQYKGDPCSLYFCHGLQNITNRNRCPVIDTPSASKEILFIVRCAWQWTDNFMSATRSSAVHVAALFRADSKTFQAFRCIFPPGPVFC